MKIIESEFQEKVKAFEEGVEQNMQKNLAVVLKRLGEANPNIKIDFQDLYVNVASDNDDDAPITGFIIF